MTLLTPLPPWALAIAAVAIAWLAFRTYAGAPIVRRRRALLTGLRLLAFLALAVFLLRPAIVRPLPRTGFVVPVVIDASRSMAIADPAGAGDDGVTRFARAVALARGALSDALAGYRLELLELRNDVAPLDPSRPASGDASDLSSALETVRERYRDRSVPGIVLLSDGVDTGDGPPLPGSFDVAVFPIAMSGATELRDQEVVSVDLDPEALPGSTVDLRATIVGHGFGREPIDVRLLASGRPIEMRRVEPAADGLPVRVTFELPPAADGPVVYTVDVPARPGEAVLDNNSRQALVQPIGRKRRLLFVQGLPGHDHGFLSRAWANDPFIELDIVVRKGQNDRGDATFYVQASRDRAPALAAGLPADRAAAFAYDGIILGNATRDLLDESQLDLLDGFVTHRGGGVLVLGARSFGPEGTASGPLGALLPVGARQGPEAARASWRGAGLNKLALTSDGERHAMLRLAASRDDSARRWNGAPPLASIAPMGSLRPGAQVLAVAGSGGASRPLVAVQRYGEGRTMVFAGEASWRWKMQRPLDDRLYDTFWRQAARWLSAPAPDPVAIDVDADPRPGMPATIGVSVRDEAFEAIRDASVEVVVRDARGAQEVLRASLSDATRGRYTATWQPPARGLFRVSASARRAAARFSSADRDVLAGAFDQETADPRRQPDVLARIAENTGGKMVPEAEIATLAGALRARAEASPRVTVQELWHGPWTFAALVLLLSAEWALRRHWGLR